jgi:opacity protein-like surface antigen
MKIIILFITTIFLNASYTLASESGFYLKANLGLSKLSDLKFKQDITSGSPATNVKSNSDVHVGAGVGYNLQDKVRFDLVYDHYVNPTYKTPINSAEPVIHDHLPQGCIRHIKGNRKINTNIDTLLFNGYVNLFDIKSIKCFVGAGFGVSFISAKSVLSSKETLTQGGVILLQDDEIDTSTVKIKSKIYAAYAAYLGASYEFTKNIVCDFTYSFRKLGSITRSNEGLIMGHHLTAGIRLNI